MAFMFASMCATVLNAQVPDSIRQQFKKSYPNIGNAQWKMENGDYYATYRDSQDLEHTVIYDKNGKPSGQRYQVSSKNVPSGVSDYYKTNFPGEKNYKVWMEEDRYGMKSYFIQRKNEKLYFDQNGKYLRKEPLNKGGMEREREKEQNKDMNKDRDKKGTGTGKDQDKDNDKTDYPPKK